MRLATPRWWYVRRGAPAPMTRAVLRPVSWIWAAVTAWRVAHGEGLHPGPPVICVGNLTMGGAGKTPTVREITRLLRGLGVDAHVLSRGHGGRLAGPVRVDPQVHAAADVGDEPLMLAEDAPVWVARRRPEGATAAAAAGAQAIVMDDGHQNASLRKALSLVVVDAETRDKEWPFGDGAVFPSGPMREPLAAGLARADAVVLLLPADLAAPDPELLAAFGDTPVLLARLAPAAAPPAGPQVAFAGIGKPWKMERALKAAGCDLREFFGLPDHMRFAEADLAFYEEVARGYGAGLLTSEKDWMRLPDAWRAKVAAWPVRARFEDEAALARLILPLVRR